MGEWSIDEIMEALQKPGRWYPREAVEAAVARREEITPRLLGCLEEMAADPDGWLDAHRGDLLPCFAMALLAHFREARAHEVVLRVVALEPDTVDWLIGPFVGMDLPLVFARTYDDALDGLAGLLGNPEALEYVRSDAASALAYLVKQGRADRERVEDLLAARVAADTAAAESDQRSGAAQALIALKAVRHRAVLDAAVEAGVLGTWTLQEVDEALAEDGSRWLGYTAERDEETREDVHAWMSGWAEFQPRRPFFPETDEPGRSRVSPAKRAKTKAARKQATKARQKSRKKRKK